MKIGLVSDTFGKNCLLMLKQFGCKFHIPEYILRHKIYTQNYIILHCWNCNNNSINVNVQSKHLFFLKTSY